MNMSRTQSSMIPIMSLKSIPLLSKPLSSLWVVVDDSSMNMSFTSQAYLLSLPSFVLALLPLEKNDDDDVQIKVYHAFYILHIDEFQVI